MGILNLLTGPGSKYSKYDGGTPPTNPNATNASRLHANLAGDPGFSLDGSFPTINNLNYNAYDDGDPSNSLPSPSQLDLTGNGPINVPANNHKQNYVPGKPFTNPETGITYP